MPSGRISWPSDSDFNEFSDLICARHPLLQGAFGSIDGLNLPVGSSGDTEVENATYNGWLHKHCISNVFVFSPKGESTICS